MGCVVYIAGPMSCLTPDEIFTYRNDIRNTLSYYGLRYIDPIDSFDYYNPSQYEPSEILCANKLQIDKSDIVLADFRLQEAAYSIGTIGEIVYAADHHKPVVAIGPTDNMTHPWIAGHISVRFYTLEEACDYIAALLPQR